jgi:biotin carboxyl carrier protein
LRINNSGFTREQVEEAFREVHPAREGREIPISNLYQRLGLKPYDRIAEFKSFDDEIKELVIPLKYNFGKAAIPVVKAGSKVTAGEMIASTDENDLSVPVHSGIDGIVKSISDKGILISANY